MPAAAAERGNQREALTPDQQRRNLAFLAADLGLFMAALGLFAPQTLVPLFVSKVTSDPLAIGAVTAAFQLGWLPQIFAAGYVERSARKLPWALIFSGLERVPVLGLALLALAAPSLAVGTVLVVVYLCCFGQALGAGLATTPWLDIIARAVPARWRGRFMGGVMTAGQLAGAAAAALAAILLDRLAYPIGFAACFGLGFVVLVVGFIPLFFVKEPPGPPPRPPRPFRQQLADLPAVLRADPLFRHYLIGLCLIAVGTTSIAGFLVVYGAQRFGASDELAGWYTAAMLVAQVVGTMVFGWLADRRGYTAVARVAGLATAATGGLAVWVGLAGRDALWLLGPFGLLGFAFSGAMLARFTGPMDFAPADRRPTYVALAGAGFGLVASVAPLVGGQIIAQVGYEWLFAASAALALAGTLVLRTED